MSDENPLTALPFDEAACEEMRRVTQRVMAAHPEIRSVAVVFDYRDKYAKSDAQRVLWLGPTGDVTQPDAVVGSMQATLVALGFMHRRAADLEAVIRNGLFEMLNQAVLHEEKEKHGQDKPQDKAVQSDPAP